MIVGFGDFSDEALTVMSDGNEVLRNQRQNKYIACILFGAVVYVGLISQKGT